MSMQTASRTITSNGILEVEWSESTGQKLVGVELGHISRELDSLATVVGLSSAIASSFKPDASPYERVQTFNPQVHRVHFGSPLMVEIALLPTVTESVAALAFLIYACKRAWGIDLEFKTHREDMRRRFIEAKRKADAAQERVDTAWKEASPSQKGEGTARDRALKEVERDLDWGADATLIADTRQAPWGKGRGSVRIEDS